MKSLDRPLLNRRSALLLLAGGAAHLSGCGGGGGGVASLTSGGTGSFTSGTITGFGSIIVNGIRYDDSAARIVRNDAGVVSGLALGMVVSISGTPLTPVAGSLSTATANTISYCSEWVGQVQAPNNPAGTFALMGQTVVVSATTVFEGAGVTQLAGLNTTHFVEVHGYLDTGTGQLNATRVEVSTTAPSEFRLSGKAGAWDTVARTFTLGTAVISYAGTTLPTAFANGSLVRVRLNRFPVLGTWEATRIDMRTSPLQDVEVDDDFESEIHGTVTAFTSAASFSVNGVPVDASAARVTGSLPLALGVAVEVEGQIVAGVLVASTVETETAQEQESQEFDFYGAVSNLDTSTRSFTVRGVDIAYTVTTSVEVPGWVTGATPFVKVKALLQSGSYIATEIRPAS